MLRNLFYPYSCATPFTTSFLDQRCWSEEQTNT